MKSNVKQNRRSHAGDKYIRRTLVFTVWK